ncbi:MAG: small basic protein [Candidatus Omnitrophica bacterium]|nr:small basic protein [Candidatus Omnitrophota bacterium]
MSQHPSLKSSRGRKKHRTVLKRFEKFFALKEKGVLKDGDSVFGMPKLKIVRVKVKKEKAEEKPEDAQVVAGATQEGGAAKKETGSKPKEEKKK